MTVPPLIPFGHVAPAPRSSDHVILYKYLEISAKKCTSALKPPIHSLCHLLHWNATSTYTAISLLPPMLGLATRPTHPQHCRAHATRSTFTPHLHPPLLPAANSSRGLHTPLTLALNYKQKNKQLPPLHSRSPPSTWKVLTLTHSCTKHNPVINRLPREWLTRQKRNWSFLWWPNRCLSFSLLWWSVWGG